MAMRRWQGLVVRDVRRSRHLSVHAAQTMSIADCGSRSFSVKADKLQEQARKWQAQKPEEKAKFLSVKIDRSALKQPMASVSSMSADALENKTKETDLVHLLRTMIEVKGPLTVAEFMQRALGHPEHGYYMKRDVFGVKGDFTTAPEISQMFGELIGVWCVATWQQMGMPSHVKIVEMGPGRGSLMSDFLRAVRAFPSFMAAIEIHMVEMSPALREIQQRTLGCEPLSDDSDGDAATPPHTMRLPNGGPTIQWHEDVSRVPHGPTLFVAQELFDALPVHQFEYTDRGWCERLVDADFGSDGEDHFRFVLSPGPTPATRVYIGRQKLFDPQSSLHGQQQPTLLGINSNNIDEMLAGTISSPVQRLDVEDAAAPVRTSHAQVGDRIEISPVSIALAQDIAKRVALHGGGALIVDYGHDHPSELSLRGIQGHEFVSVLREPGEVDLSIDVDFGTLRKYATAAEPGVRAYGPIGQGAFLKAMGIEHRLAALLQNCESESDQETLFSAYERLVNDDQMGAIFKALAITNTQIGRPVGFEEAPETTSSL